MPTRVPVIFLSVTIFAMTACGRSEPSDDTEEPAGPSIGTDIPDVVGMTGNPELDDLPAKSAVAICLFVERCLPGLATFVGGENCSEEIALSILESSLASVQSSIESGRLIFQADQFDQCIDEYAKLDCEQLDLMNGTLGQTCDAAFEAQVDVGGACNQSEECKGKAYCDLSQQCPDGKCVAQEPLDGECWSDEQCEPPLYCGDGRCREYAQLGASCNPNANDPVQCVFGAICDQISQVCTSTGDFFSVPVGDQCNPISGQLCVEGAFCNFVSGRCERVAKIGDACQPGLLNPCVADAYCEGLSPINPSATGICVQFPTEGEACLQGGENEILIFQCASGLTCIQNRCRTRSMLGDVCGQDGDCYSGQCFQEKCVTPDPCRTDTVE